MGMTPATAVNQNGVVGGNPSRLFNDNIIGFLIQGVLMIVNKLFTISQVLRLFGHISQHLR